MCTTDRQLVRSGSAAACRGVLAAALAVVCSGRGLAAAAVLCGRKLAAAAGAVAVWATGAGLAEPACTTPDIPQLASTSTGTNAATAIRACRSRAPRRQPLRRLCAHHFDKAPRRIGSST